MFESTPINPPDAIFGLIEEFKRDPNPDKINLTVGMYQDESGNTPLMQCVKQAEQFLLDQAAGHVYLPIDGLKVYNDLMPRLIFGASHQVISDNCVHSAQTPGGTGALRVAAELLVRNYAVKRVWVSQPTWANHLNIFPAAGLEIANYHYLDESGTKFNFEGFIESIAAMNSGDAILLHTVCHNPSGVDPTPEQWTAIIAAIQAKGLIPIFDFAYQGFGVGVEEDAFPIREYCKGNSEAIVCNSFSKNFNLYGERVGAITVVAGSESVAAAVLSQVKKIIRTIYSNPPLHGAAIVATVLADQQLNALWREELEAMRLRITQLRQQFVAAIADRLPDFDFDHVLNQRGMFSYSGISGEPVATLKNEHAVYLLKSGRINIAGINSNSLGRLCDSIAAVVG